MHIIQRIFVYKIIYHLLLVTLLSGFALPAFSKTNKNKEESSTYSPCDNGFSGKTGVSFATGYGLRHIVPIRVALRHGVKNEWFQRKPWPVGAYFEGAYYHLGNAKNPRPDPEKHSNTSLDAGAIAGVLRFHRKEKWGWIYPYVDIGVGLSYLTKKEIGGRELGMHFQFEDRLGFGFQAGEHRQWDIGYRFLHFSNAFLGSKNHGIDLHLIVIGYWF